MPDRATPDAPRHFFSPAFPARNAPPSPSQGLGQETAAAAPLPRYIPHSMSPQMGSQSWDWEHEGPSDRRYRDAGSYSPTQRFNRGYAPVRGQNADHEPRRRLVERPQSRPREHMRSPRGMRPNPRAFTPDLGRHGASLRGAWSSPRGYSPWRRSQSLSPGWQPHSSVTDQSVYLTQSTTGQMPWGRLPAGRGRSKRPRSRSLSPQWQSPVSLPCAILDAALFGNLAANRPASRKGFSPNPRNCMRIPRGRSPGLKNSSLSPMDCSPSPRGCSIARRDSPTDRPHVPKRHRISICQNTTEQDANVVAARAAANSPESSMPSPKAHASAEHLSSSPPLSLPDAHSGRSTLGLSSPSRSSRSADSRHAGSRSADSLHAASCHAASHQGVGHPAASCLSPLSFLTMAILKDMSLNCHVRSTALSQVTLGQRQGSWSRSPTALLPRESWTIPQQQPLLNR